MRPKAASWCSCRTGSAPAMVSCFDGDREHGLEQGGRVYDIFQSGRRQDGWCESGIVELTFRSGAVDADLLRPGQKVWKTDDPQLNKRLRATFNRPDARRTVAVDMKVVAVAGQPLHVVAQAGNGACWRVMVGRRHSGCTQARLV